VDKTSHTLITRVNTVKQNRNMHRIRRIKLFARKLIPWMLLVVMLGITACDPPWVPEIDFKFKEAKKNMQTYLRNKYHKEFVITGMRRSCSGFRAGCEDDVNANAYPKDRPDIRFYLIYDSPTKKTQDIYIEGPWEKQIKDDLKQDIEQTFHVKPQMMNVSVLVDEKRLNLDSFPYYLKVLGGVIQSVDLDIEIDQCRIIQQEAQKLIDFKQRLSANGISESQMKYFSVNINDKKEPASCYEIQMDQAVDLQSTLKKMDQLAPRTVSRK